MTTCVLVGMASEDSADLAEGNSEKHKPVSFLGKIIQAILMLTPISCQCQLSSAQLSSQGAVMAALVLQSSFCLTEALHSPLSTGPQGSGAQSTPTINSSFHQDC